MAYSSFVMQRFCLLLPSDSNPSFFNPPQVSASSISLRACSKSLPFAFSPYKAKYHHFKLMQLCRVNSQGVPNELIDDPKFVPLNADDPRYGPPALLLLGFEVAETQKIRRLLQELDGEFLKVIHCTEDMIDLSLWEAVHIEQPNVEAVKIAKLLPRICFLSGLTGEEMMMFIDAFPETGLEPAVFAALVPNSANKLLREVIEEIMGDHEMMTAKQ